MIFKPEQIHYNIFTDAQQQYNRKKGKFLARILKRGTLMSPRRVGQRISMDAEPKKC